MTDQTHGTSGNVELTEERLRELNNEAERGFEPSRLRSRSRRGRPPLGREAARVFQVRLEPALRTALQARADDEATTPSDIARRALREFLHAYLDQGHSETDHATTDVAPNPDGGWDVHVSQGQTSASHHATQREAIERARHVLTREGGGELRIHGRDGRVREKKHVARSGTWRQVKRQG